MRTKYVCNGPFLGSLLPLYSIFRIQLELSHFLNDEDKSSLRFLSLFPCKYRRTWLVVSELIEPTHKQLFMYFSLAFLFFPLISIVSSSMVTLPVVKTLQCGWEAGVKTVNYALETPLLHLSLEVEFYFCSGPLLCLPARPQSITWVHLATGLVSLGSQHLQLTYMIRKITIYPL